ncbi:MAG: Ig-like domain-containing protein [Bacteroidales bacterium]|jgi:hypothetical protein|nr:Ig-like domain-containing protein [Bacteroidales bacterium]
MKNGFLFFLLLLLASCAQIVIPVGGPKDVTPPSVTKEIPENKSLDFNGKNIRITFDEYVVLANPNDNIFFSPPLKNQPSYLLRGKILHIKINDTLHVNKTYNIAFSNAIKDYTEGNMLPFYLYSFSTGSYIDTFMVSGRIIDAKTIDPMENILVLLYDQNIDSLPFTELPSYITKSQKNGSFEFKHIAEGDYKIIALKDINNNMLYDLVTEGIAFCDTLVRAKCMGPAVADTAKKESTMPEKDRDEIGKEEILTLSLFVQEDTVQRLLKVNVPQKDVYQIPYKRPFQMRQVRPLGNDYPGYVERIGITNDTLFWYFKQPVVDSLLYEITLDGKQIDTIELMPSKALRQRGRGKKEETNPFVVSHSNAGNLFQPLTLHFSLPVLQKDTVPVIVISTKKNGGDTLLRHYVQPENYAMSLPLPFEMEEKVPYVVILRDSIFTTINGYTNDSIAIKFNSKSEKDYGNLTMEYEVLNPELDYIISLENVKGFVIQQDIINTSKAISYMHLTPGDYKIRVIEDRNKNGRWDTGNYHWKLQPEKLYFYDKTITIRGYWDLEEEMKVGQ